MISVLTLHNEVRSGLNRLNTDFDKSVNTVNIDESLNKAKDFLLENFSRLAERNKTFENILRSIEVPEKSLKLKSDTDKGYTIGLFPEDYYDYLSIKAIGEKDGYRDLIWNSNYYQRDDTALYDPNYEPSWEWRSGLYNISKENIMYYHNKKYKVVDIIISYIQKIPDVAAPSLVEGGVYRKANGEAITNNINLEIDHPSFWRKMCDLAIFYIRIKLDSTYKQSIDEIMFNETTAISSNK